MVNLIPLNVKYLAEKYKLSQKEFGELFGLKQAVVSAYIRGVSNPQINTLIQISEYFDVSIDDLIKHDLSNLSEIRVNKSKKEEDCKICDMYERMLEDKERIIRGLERELAALRGLDFPDESQTA